MQQPYNLEEDLQDAFEFVLGGKTYRMRYPTTEEVQQAEAVKDKTPEDQLAWVYSFISAVDADAPAIADALKTKSVKVMQAFNSMIQKEFSAQA